jgi:hypothetical protein
MYTSTSYGKTGKINPMLSSVIILLHAFTFFSSGKNALDCHMKQTRL